MIEITADSVNYFCTKHGGSSSKPGICSVCGQPLVQSTPSYLKYICEQCGEIVSAEIAWLEVNAFTCPSCNGVHYLVNKCLKNEKAGWHVKIDGVFDGVPIGKKIREKNEQVKKHFAGYSYEQNSIKEKVNGMVNERLQNK
jgi:predicted RNA-binding Zn-ribbon protein involved in translation (DUF1610 family)